MNDSSLKNLADWRIMRIISSPPKKSVSVRTALPAGLLRIPPPGHATAAGEQLVIDGACEARSLRPSFLAMQSSAFPHKTTPVAKSAGIIISAVPAG
ncbi:hypothetical protein ACIA5G_45785 [Amycolatopsis sp. NPDC051758]|uniref:hypothetical protein n=1 Tax=Amycolatopsis sp. NPDC051758 TaxID=3363935 RepID=UPI0037989A65